ncbi:MAG: tRNA (guanosine(46)-N7)-methyltransferase TrmB [Gammaproteobacteria bacterium]|jgi:tRNA (guanine-N7-)-methyltransferase
MDPVLKTTPADNRPLRKIRSFVRREGRITVGQQRALQELWPRYGLEADAALDMATIFGRSAPCTLEIGFGNGDVLATLAEQQPQCDFIGIEVHRPGVGRLLQQLAERELNNVRVMCADAVQVLKTCFPDNSLDRVLLFFPDPWHKKRHRKRRLVQPDFIELLSGKIRPGGCLHMATDWQDYAEHMLEVMERSPRFRNSAAAGHFSPRPDYRPVTRFEQRGQRLGHGVWDLLFERV